MMRQEEVSLQTSCITTVKDLVDILMAVSDNIRAQSNNNLHSQYKAFCEIFA